MLAPGEDPFLTILARLPTRPFNGQFGCKPLVSLGLGASRLQTGFPHSTPDWKSSIAVLMPDGIFEKPFGGNVEGLARVRDERRLA